LLLLATGLGCASAQVVTLRRLHSLTVDQLVVYRDFIRLGRVVSPHVRFKCRGANERRLTDIAFEGPLSSMTAHMIAQVPMRSESKPTDLALVGLDSVVDPHVDFEVAALREPFLAHCAFKRFNPLVGPDMNL